MPRRIEVLSKTGKALVHASLITALAYIAQPVRFRGVQRLTWIIGRYFPADHAVAVRVSPDTRLVVPLNDGYWTKLINPRFRYEPEIKEMLDRLLTSDTYFVDGGANIGYWSLISRNRARAVIAIEANPETFDRLQRNANLNDAGIHLVQAALWETDGLPLTMLRHDQQHAGATVLDNPISSADGWEPVDVTSITLRTVLDRFCPDVHAPVVIKLDVEGAEIPALVGMGELLHERNVVLIYEDHGSDTDCTVSRYLSDLGMILGSADSSHPLSVEDIAGRKKQKWRGYNFFACSPSQYRALELLGVATTK